MVPGFGFIADKVAGVALKVIGEFHASPEDKMKMQTAILQAQAAAQTEALEYEKHILTQHAENIRAEIKSDSWLAANWRPMVMLGLFLLVAAHWVGLTPENIDAKQADGLLDIVKIGLGGYTLGRSAEKIAKTIQEKK